MLLGLKPYDVGMFRVLCLDRRRRKCFEQKNKKCDSPLLSLQRVTILQVVVVEKVLVEVAVVVVVWW